VSSDELGDGGGGLGDGGGGLGDGGGGEGEGGGGEGEGGGEGGSGGFAKNVIMGIFPKCLNPMILRPREQIQLLPLCFVELSSLLTVKTLKGMTTDVYPRENCIAPAIVFIVWTTNTNKEIDARARAEVAMGRDGRHDRSAFCPRAPSPPQPRVFPPFQISGPWQSLAGMSGVRRRAVLLLLCCLAECWRERGSCISQLACTRTLE